MTDDLVKRLRANASWGDDRFAEAADRIEQLTAERDEALECNEQFFVDNQFLKKRAEKAEAERDRLQAALWAILACETPNANATVTRMAHLARAALKGETP